MRPLRGLLAPSPGADATSSRAAGMPVRLPPAPLAAAFILAPRSAAALAFGAADLPLWAYVAIGLGLVAIACGVWFLWVRAEVRSLRAPAFLVMRADRAARMAIAGAEADSASGAGPGLNGHAAVRQDVVAQGPAAFPFRRELAAFGGEHYVFAAAATPMERPAIPADATLQFLPGRLECLCEPRRPDVRFVRQPGPATVITIGRANGAPDRHIHVPGGTVSRLHARLRYAAGRWTISNLSATNPLRVNGRPLDPAVEACVLADGDRLELGEVAFIFREKSL